MKTTRAFVCAALLVTSASAKATIIVDGESLELTGRVSEPVVILHGGRVTLNDGEIIAPAADPDPENYLGRTGTVSLAQPSSFEMLGHSFLTSTNSVPLLLSQFTTARLADHAVIVAGTNGTAIESRDNAIGSAIYLEDHATVVGNIFADTNLFIADDARITGRLNAPGSKSNLNMSGGSINGGVSLVFGGSYSAEISGGRIDNGFHFGFVTGIPRFTMSGGEIYGGFSSQGSFREANIFGGSIYGGLEIGYTREPLSIWGGTFNADADGWLIDAHESPYPEFATRRSLAIYGGQFGSLEAGLGIRLTGTGAIDVYGYDLSLTNGLLSGYLSDGNWISLSVSTNSDWLGSVNLFDVRKTVPEPSSIALFLTALAAGGFGWRQRRATGARSVGLSRTAA